MIYEGFVCANCNDFHRERNLHKIKIKTQGYYYLSFADEINNQPVFIGGVFIKASTSDEAYRKIKESELRETRGQILFFRLETHDKIPSKNFINRLLSEQEVKNLVPDAKRIDEIEGLQ